LVSTHDVDELTEDADDTLVVIRGPATAQRADVVVAAIAEVSRSRAGALIDGGHVALEPARKLVRSTMLQTTDTVVVTMPAPLPTDLIPEDIPLDVVFEDDDLIVVNKQPGLVVHPSAGHASGTLCNAVRFRWPHITTGGALRPGLVHRLDKETSGLLVLAKNDRAHAALSASFASRQIDKRYVALIHDTSGRAFNIAEDMITGHGRHPRERRRFTTLLPPPVVDTVQNKRAHSTVQAFLRRDTVTAVSVRLHTGRTHQIRAHLADRHMPILHDGLYGFLDDAKRVTTTHGPLRHAVALLERHALHAHKLTLTHPTRGDVIHIEAPIPADLAQVLEALQPVA
jgi:23S rRNA pseudouridine1911/1915/1917 synthase